MNNLGLILNHVGASQASFYGINFLNHWVSQGNDHPATLFVQNVSDPCIPVQTAIMETSELMDFRGNIVCTNAHQASQVLAMPNPSTKYLYVWDLEWRRENKNFEYYMGIMRHPDLQLVARSKTHSKHIAKYCNKQPIAVVEDFNFTELLNG